MTLPLPAFASQHAVLNACASRDGSMWCGTDGAGIFRWQAEQMIHFGIEQGVTSLHVAALLEDRHTNLWAGTYAGLFRRVGGRFEPAPGPPALREPILALREDHQGNLWTGGRAGLVRLNAEGARLFGAEEGLFGGAVRALAEDRNGHIWVGPNAGLYWLNGEVFQYDSGSGLTEIILLSDSLDEALRPTPADQKMVGEISARARSLTRAMDEVVWAINPRNDTLEGFLTYLVKFTQDYLTRAEIRCRWNVPVEVPEPSLAAETRHNLYLACKEVLHHVVKHAGASEVSVRLDLAEGDFTLEIADDGRGFAAALLPARGNGLSNMRQRLKELDGVCHVESVPGQGTRVLFSLPRTLNKSLPA